MTKIDSLISIFRNLSHAGYSISGKQTNNSLETQFLEDTQLILDQISNEESPINEIIEEIESQLGQHNQPAVAILRILRKFTDISPYLLITLRKEKTEKHGSKVLNVGNTTYYSGHYYCHDTLERYCNWVEPRLDYFSANTYEKYIVQCFNLFNNFFNQLDKLCLDYEIDIIKIQEENGFVVWIRDLHKLIGYGYEKKLNNISSFPYQYPKLEKTKSIEIEKGIKFKAKHYVLAYFFESIANGIGLPNGKKKELEQIGNERMGAGKGNRFYKLFNEFSSKDLNSESVLFEIGGNDWRKAVIQLSDTPELVEEYLKSKGL